jgi:PBSX family phage terminase large subunit
MALLMADAMKEARRRADAAAANAERRIELRGNNLAIQTMTDEEILLCGAAGTGKTLGILYRMHNDAQRYAGSRQLIVRKVRADLAQSTLVTFERDVLGVDNPICAGVQRESRQAYRYPNGSEIVVGGMDRPGKILSADYDRIYAAEAVQFTATDWETFIMRLRTGVMPFQQLIGDTNPDRRDHWLKQRADAGTVKLLNTTHKDNPAYWDAVASDWTARGRAYVVGKLGRLTGVRKLRYLDNQWVNAEGAVYDDWNEDIHLIDPFPIPAEWRRIRAIDFGFTNPFVCLWIAVDGDGRAYVYRQIYMTERTVRRHAEQIKTLSAGEKIEATVADHDAEDRATLRENGITTLAAIKEIKPGIEAVKDRLLVAGDGKPRLFVMRESLFERDESLAESGHPVDIAGEFTSYMWAKGVDGKANKEIPVDDYNHALDALRYGIKQLTRRATVSTNSFYE